MRWILALATIGLVVTGIVLTAQGLGNAGSLSILCAILFGIAWGIVEMDRAT